MNLSPRSRRKHDYKKQRREQSNTLQGVSRQFISCTDSYDFFAKPVVSFNIRGEEKVSTKCGFFLSFILTSILVYTSLFSLVQIASYERSHKSEKLEFGEAADRRFDFIDYARNLAFRMSNTETDENNAMIDPSIGRWVARLVNKKLDNVFEQSFVEIPTKYCT